jgi:transcription factor SPN1
VVTAGNAGEEGDLETPKKPLKPGDPGFRWHASIPAPARLDYIKRPASKVIADSNGPRRAKDAGGKVSKRLQQLQRKKGSGKKMSKVSIEGRGMVI